MNAPFHFKKDSGQTPQELFSKNYQLSALSGMFNGSYGLLLEGDIKGEPARWFFPNKEELTRGEMHHLSQGLKDPLFCQQFLQPEKAESTYAIEYLEAVANKHLKGVSIISAGGNQDYPAAWASLTVIGVDTAANAATLKALKGIKGIRMGKHKGQTYLMANIENCSPHMANAALIEFLGLDDLALAPMSLTASAPSSALYPKLKRPEQSSTKQQKTVSPLDAEIEAISQLHPDFAEQHLYKLKSGNDAFSRMKAEDLKTTLSSQDLDMIERRFKPESLRLNAMRWAARGLPVSLAIKKVVLLQEDRDFFTSAHRAGQILFEK